MEAGSTSGSSALQIHDEVGSEIVGNLTHSRSVPFR